MAVKIRLMRVGKKKQPTYRVVVADARSPRDGRFIEILGQYAPRQEPSASRSTPTALHWLQHGAQPTEQAAKILEIAGVWDAYKTATGKDAAAKPKPKAAEGEDREARDERGGGAARTRPRAPTREPTTRSAPKRPRPE